MVTEIQLGGILLAPIVVYGLVALAIVALLRAVLVRTRLLRLAAHPALLELALYVSVLSLLVLFV